MFLFKCERPELRMVVPKFKNANVENGNIQLVNVEEANFALTNELEECNVNRIDRANFFERFFQNVNLPELQELSLV